MKKTILILIGTIAITVYPHTFSFPYRMDTAESTFQTVMYSSEPFLYQSELPYKVLETPHFIIRYDESHEIFAQKVADIAEGIYDDTTSFMRYTPPEKVGIDILASTIRFFEWESSFADRAYARSDEKSIILIYGCPFSTEVCGRNYLDVKRIISYGLIHILLYWILEDDTYISEVRTHHQWIITGLAAYYETHTCSRSDDFMPAVVHYLEESNEFPTCLEEITFERYSRLSSPLAGSVVQYMFDVHGEEKFYTFLGNLYWDPSTTAAHKVEKALQDAFGMTEEEFEKEWILYVKEKYPDEAHKFNATQVTEPPVWKVTSSWHGDKILFVADISKNLDIFVMNADGTNTRRLVDNESADFDPKFSPDGEIIAFTSLRKDYANIYCMDLDSFVTTQLTYGKHMDFMGSWSPDGKKIVFTSGRRGNYDIYCMNADGSHITQLTTYEGDDGWPVFSPDGQKIVFVSERGGSYDLYVMNADGTDIHQLTTTPEYENFPQYSPDGKHIAFISRWETGSELCIMNSDGTNRESIVTAPNCIVDATARNMDKILGYPVWSPDGDKIAFTAVNQIFTVSVDHSDFWVGIPVTVIWITIPVIVMCVFIWGLRRRQNRRSNKPTR